ncbi:MAG: hypothetical protein ABIY70_00830 [Capsulimonas sp.]|uniref:hypothetical protein n=1 Tax=Capsulimonas sp. TaxID=2494211 RepID=UPI00326552CD
MVNHAAIFDTESGKDSRISGLTRFTYIGPSPKIPAGYQVSPKGYQSRELIEGDNQQWNGQPSLFEEDNVPEEAFQNYWVLSEFGGTSISGPYLTIHLSLPVHLNSVGDRMTSCEHAVLFNGPVNNTIPVIIDIPNSGVDNSDNYYSNSSSELEAVIIEEN